METKVAKAIAEFEHALRHVLECEHNCSDCRELAQGALADNAKIIKLAFLAWVVADDE